MTPEGRVKQSINKLLKPYEDAGTVWRYMPVPSGYGRKTVDYLLCAKALGFIAIEAKRPGKEPTALQERDLQQIRYAGGMTFVIDGVGCLDFKRLKELLNAFCKP